MTTALLSNVSADTDGDAVDWHGGLGVFSTKGSSYGGGSVQLQYSPDGGTTWLDVLATAHSANDITEFWLPTRAKIRASLGSSTSPSGVYAYVQ